MISPAPPLMLARQSGHIANPITRKSTTSEDLAAAPPRQTEIARLKGPTMLPARKTADEVMLWPNRAMSCSLHCPQSFAAPHDPTCPHVHSTPSYAGTPATPMSLQMGEVGDLFLLPNDSARPAVANSAGTSGHRRSAVQKLTSHVRKLSWFVTRKEPKDSGFASTDPQIANFDDTDPFSDANAIREGGEIGRAREEVETINWYDVDDRFPPLVRVRANTEPYFPSVKRSLFARIFRRKSAPNEKTAPLIKRRASSWIALVKSGRGSMQEINDEKTVLAPIHDAPASDVRHSVSLDPAHQDAMDDICIMLLDRLVEREETGEFDTVARDALFSKFHGNRTTPEQQAEASRKLAQESEMVQRNRMRKFRQQQETHQTTHDPDGHFRGRQIGRGRRRVVSEPLLRRPRSADAPAQNRTESESETEFQMWIDSEIDVVPDSAFNPFDG